MKKTILFTLLLSLGAISMTNAQQPIHNHPALHEYNMLKYGKNAIAIGTINTSVTENIKIKPDTVEFSITYLTEGTTPNDASNRNASNMKLFINYLKELNITEDALTTISYQNYQ